MTFFKKIPVLIGVCVFFPGAAFAISSSELVPLSGTTTGDKFGKAVAGGDFNGDGIGDLAASSGIAGVNYVSIIYGTSTLPAAMTVSTTNSSLITGTSGDNFGGNLAVGNINGDTFDDLVISATGDTVAGGANSGGVYILYGRSAAVSSGAITSDSMYVKIRGGFGFLTGTAIAVGDINADSYDDVMIGSPNDASSGGSAAIVYGRSAVYVDEMAVTSLGRFTGEASFDDFGSGLAISDMTGDGIDDIAIGAPGNDDGGLGAGSVYFIPGQTTSFAGSNSVSTRVELTGKAGADAAGSHVAIGDVTGDGLADLLIVAAGNDDGGSNAGAVFLVQGNAFISSGSLSTAIEFKGDAASDAISKVATVDINGDGVDDLIIGASSVNSSAGAVYVGGGDSQGGSLASTSTKVTGGTSELFGSSIGGGDLNGDGFQDLYIGAIGYPSAGAAMIMSFFIDADFDGITGGGLALGIDLNYVFDCNDADVTVSEDQTYYTDADGDTLGDVNTPVVDCAATAPVGSVANALDTNDEIPNFGVEINEDSIDNDGDALIDEVNTVAENGEHPYYSTLDVTDVEAVGSNITGIEGAPAGVVTVTYADNSVYNYTVFSTSTTKVTQGRQYKSTGYAVVVQHRGKKAVLLNLYTGEKTDSQVLTNKKLSTPRILIADIRNDAKKEVVVTAVSTKAAQVFLLKIKVTAGNLVLKDKISVLSKKVAPAKTQVKKNKIILRSEKNKKIVELLVNKKYQFVEAVE